MIDNEKSFILNVVKKAEFILHTVGVTVSSSLRFFTNNVISITSSLSASIKNALELDIKKINISISEFKQTISENVGIGFGVSINYLMLSIVNILSNIDFGLTISSVLSAISRFTTSISLATIDISAIPTVGVFNTIGDFDNDTLAIMDIEDLGDLDITVI